MNEVTTLETPTNRQIAYEPMLCPVFNHGSLFSGIGGFDLAAQWMNWNNVFQVEIDNYCQKLLTKNFPNVTKYTDIREFDGKQYAGTVDIISGGFPCQPFSNAGKKQGTKDDRYLWPEMLRVVREIQPIAILGENVPGIIGMELENVLSDLENAAYRTQTFVIPACGKNAPHKRERVWIIAYNDSFGSKFRSANSEIKTETASERSNIQFETYRLSNKSNATNPSNSWIKSMQQQGKNGIYKSEIITNSNSFGQQEHGQLERPVCSKKDTEWKASWAYNDGRWPTQSPVCGRNDGIPNRVDRLKGLGNAIVPQIAFELFRSIEALVLHGA
jgi:DNA (cytosine-5)-methyltransferase 1